MISKRNLYIFYVISFLSSLIFIIPISYFFFTVYLNFGLSQAIFLTVFSGFVSMMFEIPSGAWADRIGRKKNYIIGTIILLSSFSVYIIGNEFWHFIMMGFLLGLGFAMTSGNIEAIIHDMLGKGETAQSNFNKIQSQQYIFLFLGRALSALFAGYMFVYNPLFPIIGTIISYVFIFFIILFFDNKTQHISSTKTNRLHIRETIEWFGKNISELYILILCGVILTGIGNIYWFSYQPLLEGKNISIEHIGIIYCILSFISALGSYSIGKIQNRYHSFTIAQSLLFLLAFVSILFTFFEGFYIVIPIFILSYMSGFINPLTQSYIIRHAPTTHKSTVFSIYGFVVSGSYFLFSSISGYFAEIYSLEKVYFSLIFIILGVILLDAFYIRKKIKI